MSLLGLQLKKDYLIVKKLRELSGFGWDDDLKIVTATDEVWEAYLQVCTLSGKILSIV